MSNPAFRRAASTTCSTSTEVVTLPTPPGTGVIASTTGSASAKFTSPQSLPSSFTLIPYVNDSLTGTQIFCVDDTGSPGSNDHDVCFFYNGWHICSFRVTDSYGCIFSEAASWRQVFQRPDFCRLRPLFYRCSRCYNDLKSSCRHSVCMVRNHPVFRENRSHGTVSNAVDVLFYGERVDDLIFI